MLSPAHSLVLAILSLATLFPIVNQAQDLSEINQGSSIMHPKVSYDGTKMVYLANYYGSLRPYIATMDADSNKWRNPAQIFSGDVAELYEVQYPQLNFDNTKVYFSARSADKPDFDIYYSELKGGQWSEPLEVPMDINTDVDEMAPAVSADEKKILFTRPLPLEAKADEICKELYLSELTETGAWSEPELLPPSYNTGCLCVPYFARDNKTFFFSSREEILDPEGKRISRNQFNIYWAKIDGFFRYNPRPLLSAVGEEDAVSFSLDQDSTFYYGSGDIFAKNESKRTSQIVSRLLGREFHPSAMTLISGNIKDQSGAPLEATVQVINPYTTKVFQEVNASEEGNYQVFVPTGDQFSILAKQDGYSTQSRLIQTEGTRSQNDFELFPQVAVTFNVFDEEYYFPIVADVALYDSAFNSVALESFSTESGTDIALGKELNIVFNSEDYFSDTLNLPFDQEVIFDFFDFDIELRRKVKMVDFSFTDDETGNNLGLEIIVYNVTRNEKTKRVVKDGKISLELRDGEVYEISTSAQGYSYYTAEVDLSKDDTPTEVNAELQSVENISIVLNNITFEYNSYTLNAGSYEELNKLVNYLSENNDYRVEIAAHTDNSGADAYNLRLSNLRANAVLEYLQDNSIKKDRLIARGYGESKPIYPNDNEENMARNRRVEFKILDDESQ